MFKKQKNNSSRLRQPSHRLSSDFRRNNVVISRSQREMKARQQSVTQRQEDRKKAIKRRQTKRKIIMAILVAIVSLVWYTAIINHISVTVKKPLQLDQSLKDQYSQSFIRTFHKNAAGSLYALLDEANFAKVIKAAHPEIKDIKLQQTRLFSKTIEAEIKFRKPKFVWIDSSKKQQFVDDEGVLFSTNRTNQLATDMIIIEDQGATVASLGQSVLGQKTVDFITNLPDNLPPLYAGAKIEKVIIPQATRQLQIKMASVPYLLKFSLERSLEEQVGELGTLLNALKDQKITPSQYIDLRIAHKAYYK